MKTPKYKLWPRSPYEFRAFSILDGKLKLPRKRKAELIRYGLLLGARGAPWNQIVRYPQAAVEAYERQKRRYDRAQGR